MVALKSLNLIVLLHDIAVGFLNMVTGVLLHLLLLQLLLPGSLVVENVFCQHRALLNSPEGYKQL